MTLAEQIDSVILDRDAWKDRAEKAEAMAYTLIAEIRAGNAWKARAEKAEAQLAILRGAE